MYWLPRASFCSIFSSILPETSVNLHGLRNRPAFLEISNLISISFSVRSSLKRNKKIVNWLFLKRIWFTVLIIIFVGIHDGCLYEKISEQLGKLLIRQNMSQCKESHLKMLVSKLFLTKPRVRNTYESANYLQNGNYLQIFRDIKSSSN